RWRHACFEIDRESAVDLPPRRIEHGLRLLSIVEQPHEGLHMPLGLYRAAHHADGRVGLAGAGDEPRDDGMERTLAATDEIWMPSSERKAGAAILQADAGARHDDAGAEAHVVRLDERDHHAVRVRRGEIDRSGARRRAVLEILRALAIDQTGAALK